MIPVDLVVTVMIVGTAMAFSAERAVRNVRSVQRRYKSLMRRHAEVVERVRRAGMESLQLKRELRSQRLTMEDLREELNGMEDDISRVSRPEYRIFVLDERRMPGDHGWAVLVAAPSAQAPPPPPIPTAEDQPPRRPAPQPWQGNRRFRVWAPDEATARYKTEKRYPPADGYRILSAHPHRVGQAPPAAG